MLFSSNPFKRPWGFILITLLFACVGAGIFLFVLTPIVYDGLRMSFWPSTKGNLVDVRRAFHKSGESREHTAYDIQARYSYTVEGVGYSNDRIYISEFSYNSGSAHQDFSRSLEVAFASKSPITIWYNYDNPQQSIVDRTLKWDLIFTLFILSITFMPLGVGGTILLWRADNPPREFSSTKPPWLQLRCWRTNQIKSQCSGHLAEACLWNLVWNGLSISTSIKTVPQSLESGNYGGLIVLVFPIVGLAL